MSFHHQADQAFPLLVGLGEELFRRGQNGLHVRLDLDLRYRLDRDRHALLGVEVLLWGHVERHQFQRKLAAYLDHGEHQSAVALHYSGPAQSVDDQGFMGAGLAIKPGHAAHQKQNDHDSQANENPDLEYVWNSEHIASSFECPTKLVKTQRARNYTKTLFMYFRELSGSV